MCGGPSIPGFTRVLADPRGRLRYGTYRLREWRWFAPYHTSEEYRRRPCNFIFHRGDSYYDYLNQCYDMEIVDRRGRCRPIGDRVTIKRPRGGI